MTLSLTFQQNTRQAATNSPNTFTAQGIGSAFSSRNVICLLVLPGSYNGAPTGVTIGGVTATIQAYVGSGASIPNFSSILLWAWANVPTGTTADVVVTGGASVGDGIISCATYTFDGSLAAASPTESDNNVTATTSDTVTLNTSAGGFIIAGVRVEPLGSPTGLGITASTETYANDVSNSTDHVLISSVKSGSTADTPTSVTFGWTGSLQAIASLLAWAPAAAAGGGTSTLSMMGVGHHKHIGWTPLMDRRARIRYPRRLWRWHQ